MHQVDYTNTFAQAELNEELPSFLVGQPSSEVKLLNS
jgi:hypothetical protein